LQYTIEIFKILVNFKQTVDRNRGDKGLTIFETLCCKLWCFDRNLFMG